MEKEPGYLKGETCDRDGCNGIIDEHYSEGGCSCHINPPCGYCETSREYCPECGWDGREEQMAYYDAQKPTPEQQARWDEENRKQSERDEIFYKKMRGELPIEKIEYIIKCSGNSTMTKEGFFPKGTSMSEVLKEVRGTFGGRFEYFTNRKFKYIAYTD